MFSREMIESADKWLGTVVCSFFPGVVLLDVFFGIGLFGEVPSTIYAFVLYIVYSAAISFPYVYLSQAEMEKYLDQAVLKDMEDHAAGLVTAPLVFGMTLATVVIYVFVEEIGSRNPVLLRPMHADAVNIVTTLVLAGVATPVLGCAYFRWYFKTFPTAKPAANDRLCMRLRTSRRTLSENRS